MRFPSGFLWGASTASHQVEGGNRWNDWWACEQDGRLPFASNEACEHYERYDSDFALARSWGHDAHRLSIEWSRIEPVQGQWNEAALQHYADVIASLRAHGLEPVVTLHHFSNPAWFAARGGWAATGSVALFRAYVQRVAARLAPHVRWWLTINEPSVYAKHVFSKGDWPPCRRHSVWQMWRGIRNLCRAHTAAYDVLHLARADAMVSFAHSAPWVTPRDPGRAGDRLVAQLRDFVLNELCFRLLGRAPRRVLDYVALNYYSRQVVYAGGLGEPFGVEYAGPLAGESRRFNSMGWEIFPPGLTAVLRRFSRYGLPMMITENGLSTQDEGERAAFLADHLQALAHALAEGLDVRGYFYWTLYDNFEWAEGYRAHFGLAAVDRVTQARVPRAIAAQYSAAIAASRAGAGLSAPPP